MSRPALKYLVLALVVVAASLGIETPAPGAQAQSLSRSSVAAAAQPPSVYLVRVYFQTQAERDQLARQLDGQEASTRGGYLTAIVDEAQYQALLAAGRHVEVDGPRTALLNQPLRQTPSQPAGGIPGFPCFRTVEETYQSMQLLTMRYPNLAGWLDVGDSWNKVTSGGAPGYDLKVLTLTSQARPGPKPTFFLMAAIHAREYATAEIAARFGEYLADNYGRDADVTWLLDNFQIVIMPQANPDGRHIAEMGIYQRKNANNTNGGDCLDPGDIFNQFGTDLNRNSSFEWGGIGADIDPCSQTFRGASAVSEPETAAIQAEIASLFPDQRGAELTSTAPLTASGVFVTLHSYGNEDLFPWGFTSDPAPNQTGLQTLGRKFGFYNHYLVCQAPTSQCLYGTSGTTDDWAYGELGVAAYTFEVGDWFFQDCGTFESTIWPDNRQALLYAFKAARRPYADPAGPETINVTTTVGAVHPGAVLTLTAVADDTRYASGGAGDEPAQPIAAAHYSLDAPAWISGTATISMTAVDGAFDAVSETVRATLNTTGWTPGDHLALVESQDSDGNWGVPTATLIHIIGPLIKRAFVPFVIR